MLFIFKKNINETKWFGETIRLKLHSSIVFCCLSIFFSLSTLAQTPGLIFEGTDPNNVLDPNNDGYVSLPPSETPSQFTSVGFPANILPTDVNDILYSEIAYVGIPEIVEEPTADPSKGSVCGFTDLVQDANSRSTYYNTDGTNMRFRFRLGGAASNSKGYSILIDTDEKFGFSGPNADPNAVVGNPGFEVEIVLRTNFQVDAYNVDGTTNPTLIAPAGPTRLFSTHAIKSIALTTVCDDLDFFYDFYVPFSDLVGFIDNTTKIRMVSVTSINPSGIIGSNGTADIGGVDDSSNTRDNLFIDAIDTQTPTSGDPIERASCPQITGGNVNPGSIVNGDTQVSGSSSEETGTIIEVFVNDVSQGTTTVSSSGTWTKTGLTLATDDVVKATATVPSTVASGIEKGTSIDNCDIETVLLTACTPPETPTTIEIGNSGKSIDGTITGLNGINVIINIFSNGTQVTSWGNAATNGTAGNFTTTISGTGTWSINGGGGFKALSGYYSVIIIPQSGTSQDCPSEMSNSIIYCRTSGGGADGIESGTITLDVPASILTTTSSISGVLGNTNSTTVRLFKNGLDTGVFDTFSGTTAWSLDISSISLVSGDELYVTNKEDAATCTSESLRKIVTNQSLKPTLNSEFCIIGNLMVVTGTSNEINGTIRVYSKSTPGVTTSDTLDANTTTVGTDGNWSLTLATPIAPGNYIAATVQNGITTESAISDEVLISPKTAFTSLSISSDPITEGDASITGSSSGLPTGSTIQLYLDGDKAVNSSGNDLTTTTDSSGNWTFTGLDTPFAILYTDAVVTVTATSTVAGSCESDQSSSKVVVCLPPTAPTITALSSSPICENSKFSVTINSAQPGLAYQLLDQNDNLVGPTIVGPNPAANVTIETDPISFGVTSLKVRTFKILGSCTSVESNSITITVNPSPEITLGANPSAVFNASAQTVDLTYSSTVNSPNEYRIDFDDVAFTDVSYTTLPASPISINVPASLAVGVHTATFTIRESANGCEKSYPITVTITDASSPTISLTNTTVSLCSGVTSASFAYSATTNTPNQYSIDFDDTANLQGFLDVSDNTLPLTPITVAVSSVAAEGTYNAVLTVKNTSTNRESIEYPISISVEKTNPGSIASNQTVLSGNDVAAFTSIQDATGVGGVTYQWQKSTTSSTTGFSDISGATSATFDEGTITQTTYYKRIATSVTNSCSSESNVITVNVIALAGIPMITQVYQFDNEKWIEVTNISANTILANQINVVLFRDKNFVFDGTTPDATFTLGAPLAPGQSVLIKNSTSVLGNISGSALNNTDNDLTNINGGNDIIVLSSTIDNTAWQNRYDVVSDIEDKTSLVRIDEVISTNTSYAEGEWVVFIDDAIKIYADPTVAANEGRHPHAPLVSEITGSNTEANTRLGLHRINKTTRTGNTWNNGFPDRSRFVEIAENYDHSGSKLSARKLTVNTGMKLGVTSNLLVVTNDVVLEGDIRLIDATGNSNAQLIQTHESASLVTGSGKLLVDQNSSVPSKYRYNYMGSPVKSSAGSSTYTIADVFKDGTNPTTFAGTINTNIAKDITFEGGLNYDGDTTDPITLADYWMYTFASSGGGRSAWVQKRSTGTIPNTDGFIFKGPGREQNYTFLGIPKDGTITTTVGADESYLVANPYASAISVKEFIEDNLSAITGTLYFWKHTDELADTEGTIEGHLFRGYVGGYATRTISTGVTAKAANLSGETGMVDITLEAEDTNNTISGDLVENDTLVRLNSATDSITFKSIRSVDSLRISYKSNNPKIIEIKVNDVTKTTVTLPSTSTSFNTETISLCVFVGNNITIASTDTNEIYIDYLNLYDMNGEVECSPTAGDAIFQEPEAYIPIGQGFFVAGDNVDGGTIEFNNSQREYKIEGTGSSTFFKSSSKSNANSLSQLPIIKLGMNFKDKEDGKTYHRQIAASFSSFTSFKYDKGYDAEMFDIGTTDIYWKFPNNEDKYVITGVQTISNDLQVPLEIIMAYSGEVSIEIDQIKNINHDIFITDKVEGVSYKITNNKATISLASGTYSNRFVLAFKSSGVLNVDDEIANTFTNIFVDNKNDIINVNKKQEIEINKVELFNLLGKKVASWPIKEQQENYQLKINRKLPTGVYIIKLNSDKGESNKKVIIE